MILYEALFFFTSSCAFRYEKQYLGYHEHNLAYWQFDV